MNKIPVTIIRHPKERVSKCSLQPLQGRADVEFLKASSDFKFDCTNFIILTINAPELSPDDCNHPLLILDSTWRLLPHLEACLYGKPIKRSLPKDLKTAYPRVSKVGEDPINGLASIEALYVAKCILGENDISLLNDYRWKDEFLKINESVIQSLIYSVVIHRKR